MVSANLSVPLSVNAAIAVHNLHGPDKNASHRHAAVLALLDAARGGLGGFNEHNSHDYDFTAAEAAKRGLKVDHYKYNGIVYDPTKFFVGKPRIKKIMKGGYVGADGVATPKKGDDDRRVGPDRWAMYYPVTVLALNFEFEFVVTHLMARAFTLHKWRQPLYRRSVISLADGVIAEDGIMTGDFNTNPRVDLPGVAEVNVPAPVDMGHQHYTKMMRWGNRIYISPLKAQNTPSDHHLLKGQVTFYRDPQAHLVAPPISPTPTPVPSPSPTPIPTPVHVSLPRPNNPKIQWTKYGSPVRHPWKRYYASARFKKRNPSKYKKIARWKAAYKRRLAGE